MTIIEIKIPHQKITDEAFIRSIIFNKVKPKGNFYYKILKRSIDARKGSPKFLLRVEISETPIPKLDLSEKINQYRIDKKPKQVVIVGAGPAGYFAALECLKLGIKPIVLERGKKVRDRRRDLRAIQQESIVDPNSNYCFGEGGAGTYSDGKLYTRSHKRGKIQDVLELLVAHGAKEDILIDAHPHIGSNKLPQIVSNIRNTIEENGGEVKFNAQVVDFQLEKNRIIGVKLATGFEVSCDKIILATGHSARDIYHILDQHNVALESKPFALGVRIEHPQPLIDEIQYRQNPRHENLPASSYKLVSQVSDCGVYSFCMCPGGLIVPAATAPGEIVVNGMSLSRRDSPYANSGVVTSVEKEEVELLGFNGKFGNLAFQKSVEQSIFNFGNGGQQAPSMRLTDFLNAKDSKDLNPSSYIPGLISAPLYDLLPKFIYNRLRDGIKLFDRKLKGYLTTEANVVATESRTSSPVRIPRDPTTLQHPNISNLFPCGEGAGYAGGILSAAMDGQNVARAVFNSWD